MFTFWRLPFTITTQKGSAASFSNGKPKGPELGALFHTGRDMWAGSPQEWLEKLYELLDDDDEAGTLSHLPICLASWDGFAILFKRPAKELYIACA